MSNKELQYLGKRIQCPTAKAMWNDWYIVKLSMTNMQIKYNYSPEQIFNYLRKACREISNEV